MEKSLLTYLLELQKPERKRKNKSQPRRRAKTNYERVTPMTMTEEVKAPRHTGVVKWFNTSPNKGYGFICPDIAGNDGKDVFAHITDVERSGLADLREGDRVRYDLKSNSRTGRTKAVNIELIT